MTYQLTVAAGKSNVAAPNGLRYGAGATVVLPDAEYGQLSATALANDFTGITYLGDQVTYQATLKSTVSNVVLPNGLRYNGAGGATVATLSDAEYAQLSPAGLSSLFSSVTAVSGGGGGISPPAGDIGGSASAPTVVGTHLASPLPAAQGGTGAGTGSPAAQNAVLAGPSSGGTGVPSFRALAAADVPTLNQSTSGTAAALSSTLVPASGGTGLASLTAYAPLAGGTTGTGTLQQIPVGTVGQYLASSGAGVLPAMQSPPGWQASDYSFAAMSYDPELIAAAGALTSGTIYFFGLQVRAAVTVSHIYFGVGTTAAGGTVTSGANWAGLYSSTTRLAQTAVDTAGVLNYFTGTFALVTIPIASQNLSPGLYWVALVMACTTMPALANMWGTSGAGTLYNANLTSSTYRSATGGTGTTLPGTTPALSSAAKASWTAIG